MQFVERVEPSKQTSAGPPPLLVMLHGIGADEHDLMPIATQLDPRLMVVSLRAPHPYSIGLMEIVPARTNRYSRENSLAVAFQIINAQSSDAGMPDITVSVR